MKRLLAAGCVLLSLGAATAQATLISSDDAVYGVGSLTRDTVSGLEWLDLTKSTNLSINSIQAGSGGFLAQGFAVATLGQVEAMFVSGGWSGVDDSATAGSAGNLAFSQSIRNLLGVTGIGANGPFSEGFALSSIAGLAARPFAENDATGTLGRVACTTSGFNTFTAVNTFNGCRMDLNQQFSFIGTYLVRPSVPVPEPATLALFAFGLIGAGVVRKARNAK